MYSFHNRYLVLGWFHIYAGHLDNHIYFRQMRIAVGENDVTHQFRSVGLPLIRLTRSSHMYLAVSLTYWE